jgi:hypothetical protein
VQDAKSSTAMSSPQKEQDVISTGRKQKYIKKNSLSLGRPKNHLHGNNIYSTVAATMAND